MRIRTATAALVALLLAAGSAHAQDWRGEGRIWGKVNDESGAPIEGAVIKIFLPSSNGGTQGKTNKKGEWAIAGLRSGGWQVDIEKDGYEPRRISYQVMASASGVKPITIVMNRKVAVVDPNIALKGELQKAAQLMTEKNFTAARVIYEDLLAKHPTAYQLQPLIARSYYGDKQLDKAVEHLRLALAKDPQNLEVKLLLGSVLVEQGKADEGKTVLASIDESQVSDPLIFVNVGISLMNQSKPQEAFEYFDKAIAKFPNSPDAYYLRGIIHLQNGKNDEAKADLTKFVAMAPDAPEADNAKKILEQLK